VQRGVAASVIDHKANGGQWLWVHGCNCSVDLIEIPAHPDQCFHPHGDRSNEAKAAAAGFDSAAGRSTWPCPSRQPRRRRHAWCACPGASRWCAPAAACSTPAPPAPQQCIVLRAWIIKPVQSWSERRRQGSARQQDRGRPVAPRAWQRWQYAQLPAQE